MNFFRYDGTSATFAFTPICDLGCGFKTNILKRADINIKDVITLEFLSIGE